MDHIDVIGDKRARTTTLLLHKQPEKWSAVYSHIKSLGLPVKVVHVIRNPYDNIATAALYSVLSPHSTFGGLKQANKTINVKSTSIDFRIQWYFSLFKAAIDARKTNNLDVLEIHGKDVITDPRGTLLKICDFVGVTCYDNYLEICTNKIYKSQSRTRHLIPWTDEQLKTVQENIDKYSSLKGYTYDSW